MATRMLKKATNVKKSAVVKRPMAKVMRKSAKKAVTRAVALKPRVAAASWAEDHLAILQLLHNYCHAVDRGAAEQVAALFHQDGILLPRFESDERYAGREAILGWYTRYMENFRAKVRFLRHKITVPVIEINGDEATSVCYLDADSISIANNVAHVAFGRYDDTLVKDQGRWWFKERTIIVYYRYPLATYSPGRGV